MGRIEEALAKLQAKGRDKGAGPAGTADGASSAPAVNGGNTQRIARIAERSASSVVHKYGGRSIEIDVDALRANGLLAPD
ncbi:MAG: hypothetical protein LOD94_17570, partial [Gammaproteobacteria bacterium]